MKLNTISPSSGAKTAKKRVGRGIGCGFGKTCGRGHKGQKSRSGGNVAPGFEGGQMPLARRVPKFGFTSRKGRYVAEIRLHELANVGVEIVTLDVLKEHGLVKKSTKEAKVFLSGTLDKAVTIKGLRATKGAQAAIEAAGGKVEA